MVACSSDRGSDRPAHVDVDLVLRVDDEPVALVEATSGTALKYVQAQRRFGPIGLSGDEAQHRTSDAPAVPGRREVEVLHPHRCRIGPKRYAADRQLLVPPAPELVGVDAVLLGDRLQ